VRDLVVLVLHLQTTIRPSCRSRAVVAESVLLKQPSLILNRNPENEHRISTSRVASLLASVLCLYARGPAVRSAFVLKPATLLRLHRALQTRKYRLLFSPTVLEIRAAGAQPRCDGRSR
jgi:hypothetical protein